MNHHAEAIAARVREMFGAVDRADIDGFVTYLTPDVTFRFANAQPNIGRGAVRSSLLKFFNNFRTLRHDINEMWVNDNVVICEQTVTYTRNDATRVSMPCVNILKFQGREIGEYLIYIDLAPLFARDGSGG